MYKRYSVFLILCNGILLAVLFSINQVGISKTIASIKTEDVTVTEKHQQEGFYPVIQISELKRQEEEKFQITEEDYEVMLRIVEAEAGGEDIIGKILVANVILNRMGDEAFPDTVKEVVFQNDNHVFQFSPVSNGAYERAVIGEETIEAVERALNGEDYSQGALYFVSKQYAKEDNVRWFDKCLQQVLSHGGHVFYL